MVFLITRISNWDMHGHLGIVTSLSVTGKFPPDEDFPDHDSAYRTGKWQIIKVGGSWCRYLGEVCSGLSTPLETEPGGLDMG